MQARWGPGGPLTLLLLGLLAWPARGYIQIVVTIQGVNALSAQDLPTSYYSVTVYDDTNLFVQPCPSRTFSDDESGVCRPCMRCVGAEVFEKDACVTTRDTVCGTCTVCGVHQTQVCNCGVLTPACYTGDRVCYDLVPVTMNLTVILRSSVKLTAAQQILVSGGMQSGYIDWLNATFQVGPIRFNSMTAAPNQTYVVSYTINDIYDRDTISKFVEGSSELFGQGVQYTFGVPTLSRRRLLALSQSGSGQEGTGLRAYISSLVSAVGATSTCETTGTCPPFFNNTQTDPGSCDNVCVPLPCPPGHTGDFGQCVLCANATYKNVSGNDTCTACPEGFTSPQGATNVSQCVWDPYWTSTTPRFLYTSTASSTSSYASSTAGPTTSVPTTAAPTTTTRILTTSVPTTSVPTTSVPTTSVPTAAASTAPPPATAGPMPSTAPFTTTYISTPYTVTATAPPASPSPPAATDTSEAIWPLIYFLKDLLIVMIVLFCIALCLLLSLCYWMVFGRQVRRVAPGDMYPVVRHRMGARHQ